jgi:uncharacterized protein (TIGR02270 family)
VSDSSLTPAPHGAAHLHRAAADEAHLGFERWHVELERAHDRLRRAAMLLERGAEPAAELVAAARAMQSSFRSLYDAFDGRADALHEIRDAVIHLDEADGLLARISGDAAVTLARQHLAEARRHLGVADERLAHVPPTARVPAPDLRAGGEVPALHRLDRPSLVPVIRVPELPTPEPTHAAGSADPAPRTFEELDAAFERLRGRVAARSSARAASAPAAKPASVAPVPAGFAQDPLPAIDERSFVHARARDCLDEIAMVGEQRAPLLGDPWRAALFLERRMIAAMDAIASMGSVAIAHLEPLVMDAPAKDGSRVFAIAMALGCIDGRDALAAAERVFSAVATGDAGALVRFAAASKLTPHPLVALAMRTYLADADPVLRALAIDVLGYRNVATPSELMTAATADAAPVAATALPYLALGGHPAAVEAARAAAASDVAALREAAWIALAIAGDARLPAALASALSGPSAAAAASLLALTGESADASHLLEVARAAPTRPLVDAVGWAGAASAIPALIGMLQVPEVGLAAAYALERITAAGLIEDAEIEPEDIDVAEPPEPDVGEPKQKRLKYALSDPRDLPPEPAPEIVQQPTTDVARWTKWWSDNGARFEPGSRYRRGQPYTPAVVLAELDTGPCTPAERRVLHRELCVRTGERLRFDPHDFVAVQEASIDAWRPLAARASSAPGRWTRSSRRS